MKYNKISNNAIWYIRSIILIVYLGIFLVCNVLKDIIIRFELINKYNIINADYNLIFKVISTLFIISFCVLVVLFPRLIYKNYGFYVNRYFFKIRSGVIFKTTSIVLVREVYKISLKRKLLGRIFNISSIILYTNAGNIKIKYLDNKKGKLTFNYITYAMKEFGEKNV